MRLPWLDRLYVATRFIRLGTGGGQRLSIKYEQTGTLHVLPPAKIASIAASADTL